MDSIRKLHTLGQSLWYDNIQRQLLLNGELNKLIQQGEIRGVTSNPTIFNNAIAKSTDYDSALKPMAWAGWSPEQIFDQLAIEDIRAAADLFLPLYRETHSADGYVSLEVNPRLAYDTDRTLAEANRLWNLVQRPNLMIKIPATAQGIPAIRNAIASGINVNVTLIFSIERYQEVIEAFMGGLEDRLRNGLSINNVASVASFFISRLDTKVDALLEILGGEKALSLLGKAALANAQIAYFLFKDQFSSERFKKLKEKGAQAQRPLWASTSTKNPAYRDVMYIEKLIGSETVNTIPPLTLDAFRDHGQAWLSLEENINKAREVMVELESSGISVKTVTKELEAEGVKAFADAYTSLLKSIQDRSSQFCSELGELQESVTRRVELLEEMNFTSRMFSIDPSLWTNDIEGQMEIRKRLGWLESPARSRELISLANELTVNCQNSGYTHATLLGMGGSSLSPEVFALTFENGMTGIKPGLKLCILDSTDPAQLRLAAKRSSVRNTLFIVSSKSGSTSEVNALFNYFWKRASKICGESTGEHFIAITDPGTRLETLAKTFHFRQVIQADPRVGGRYSALTAFGLIPAALSGLDLTLLLHHAESMQSQCLPSIPAARNPGLVLGAVMGEAFLHGRDKLTIICDPEFRSFGSWMEQLIAESSGKQQKGIIPIDDEPVSKASSYGKDRLFVYLRTDGTRLDFVKELRKAGQPVLEFSINDRYEIGGEFFRWEFATAVACAILGVNGFDQPDVQDNKTRTEKKIAAYILTKSLDEGKPSWKNPQASVFGHLPPVLENCTNLAELVAGFAKQTKTGDYIAINAYLPRNKQTYKSLQKIRANILNKTGLATTLGFGPRFLHSTGQLHKGGPNNGVFIQITRDNESDIMIPGEEYSFGILERAQAAGDLEALLIRNRRAIRLHLKGAKLEELLE